MGFASLYPSYTAYTAGCVLCVQTSAAPPIDRAPQVARSEAQGHGKWGRLSFAYFSSAGDPVAEQRKVGALPGAHPGIRPNSKNKTPLAAKRQRGNEPARKESLAPNEPQIPAERHLNKNPSRPLHHNPMSRQNQRKTRSLPLLAGDLQLTTMALHHMLGNRQAEARSARLS